ncbi:MAG: YoaK family protein [Cypionkella sp.]
MMRGGSSLSIMLAFLSGYVDTAVFVHMKGLFVAHVTGNFVLLGTTVAELGTGGGLDQPTILKLIAFPIFFVAAGLAAVIAGWTGAQNRTPVLLWLATALIGGVGCLALISTGHDASLAMVLVAAMAFLNAAQRMDGKLGPPFTVMTGNVTSVAIATAHRLHIAPPEREGPVGAPVVTMLLLVVGFAIGCALGAVSQLWTGLAAMILPAALLAGRLILR